MYTPVHFAEHRPEALHGFIHQNPLATLVTRSAAGLEANHIPILLVDGQTLRGHVARANPIWRESESEALAIFTDRDYYVSSSWYPSKHEHGRVVPTWNYSAVHAHGTLTFFEDRARLRDIVNELTRTHERALPEPWATSDAPPEFIDGLLNAIVGFDFRITRLEGKFKQSQNRNAADRAGVTAATGRHLPSV